MFPPHPFRYHPELYPELAKHNPQVPPIPIKKKEQKPKREKYVGIKSDKPMFVERINITQQQFKQQRGIAYEKYDYSQRTSLIDHISSNLQIFKNSANF